MDERSETVSSGKLKSSFLIKKPEVSVDSESTAVYNKTVKLRSKISARLEYTGQVSGKLYVWNQAGSVVEVDEADSGILLAKRRGSASCCGNSKDGKMVFEQIN